MPEPPTLVGEVTPGDLERLLLSNGLTGPFLTPDSGQPRIYQLALPVGVTSRLSFTATDGVGTANDYLGGADELAAQVTFDRNTWDESDDANLVFLTYGTPELAALLPRPVHDD